MIENDDNDDEVKKKLFGSKEKKKRRSKRRRRLTFNDKTHGTQHNGDGNKDDKSNEVFSEFAEENKTNTKNKQFEHRRLKEKKPFTQEEKECIISGVDKYGLKWKDIQLNSPLLQDKNRSQSDIRCCYRNMTAKHLYDDNSDTNDEEDEDDKQGQVVLLQRRARRRLQYHEKEDNIREERKVMSTTLSKRSPAPALVSPEPSATKLAEKRFTDEEKQAILDGVEKYGTKWRKIQLTSPVESLRTKRTNVNIKDCYRNMMLKITRRRQSESPIRKNYSVSAAETDATKFKTDIGSSDQRDKNIWWTIHRRGNTNLIPKHAALLPARTFFERIYRSSTEIYETKDVVKVGLIDPVIARKEQKIDNRVRRQQSYQEKGRQKKRRRFTQGEKQEVLNGVTKFGEGQWARIVEDSELLQENQRTNVNIKDWYRTWQKKETVNKQQNKHARFIHQTINGGKIIK